MTIIQQHCLAHACAKLQTDCQPLRTREILTGETGVSPVVKANFYLCACRASRNVHALALSRGNRETNERECRRREKSRCNTEVSSCHKKFGETSVKTHEWDFPYPQSADNGLPGRFQEGVFVRSSCAQSLIGLSNDMTNISAALAMVITVFLTGHATAVLADEGVLYEEQRIGESVATGTGSEKVGADPMAYSGTKAIRVYLGVQTAFLTESGTVVKTYRISSGSSSTPTPRGIFQIHKKQDLRVSSQAVPYRMPNYMAFTKNLAFGLHGLPYLGKTRENSAYWNEAQDHIGTPVSHGCVRFLPEEAVEIYEWVEIGMPVFIEL